MVEPNERSEKCSAESSEELERVGERLCDAGEYKKFPFFFHNLNTLSFVSFWQNDFFSSLLLPRIASIQCENREQTNWEEKSTFCYGTDVCWLKHSCLLARVAQGREVRHFISYLFHILSHSVTGFLSCWCCHATAALLNEMSALLRSDGVHSGEKPGKKLKHTLLPKQRVGRSGMSTINHSLIHFYGVWEIDDVCDCDEELSSGSQQFKWSQLQYGEVYSHKFWRKTFKTKQICNMFSTLIQSLLIFQVEEKQLYLSAAQSK